MDNISADDSKECFQCPENENTHIRKIVKVIQAELEGRR